MSHPMGDAMRRPPAQTAEMMLIIMVDTTRHLLPLRAPPMLSPPETTKNTDVQIPAPIEKLRGLPFNITWSSLEKANKPTHDVNDAKERCSLDAVSIFEVSVSLLVGGLGDVHNLCVWDVLLLHFEVFLLNNLVCAVGFTQLDCSRRGE